MSQEPALANVEIGENLAGGTLHDCHKHKPGQMLDKVKVFQNGKGFVRV